jgi:hypothetical protein
MNSAKNQEFKNILNMKTKLFFLSIVAFLFAIQTAKAQYNEQIIIANDPGEFDDFGFSVGVSGDYLISGARGKAVGGSQRGAAYIFSNNNGTWEQQSELTYANAQDGDHFGKSVCIDEDFLIATATGGKGYAIVYYFNNGSWEQQQVFEKPELNENEGFGNSSDIDGNNFILGLRPFNSTYGKGGAYTTSSDMVKEVYTLIYTGS